MRHEIYVLLATVVCGIALSILLDFRRGLQKAINFPDFIVIAADIIYWCAAFAAAVWVIWFFNSGKVRAYEIIGFASGSLLYFFTISPFVLQAFTWIIENILKIIRFIFKILLTPIRFLYKIILVYTLGKKRRKKEEYTANERIKRKAS